MKHVISRSPGLLLLLLLAWAAFSFLFTAPNNAHARGIAQVELLRIGTGVAIYFTAIYGCRSRFQLRTMSLMLVGGAVLAAFAAISTSSLLSLKPARGAFGEEQLMGAFLATLLPVAAVFALKAVFTTQEKLTSRIIKAFGTVIVLCALLLTGERVSWISGMAGTLLAIGLAVWAKMIKLPVAQNRPTRASRLFAPVLAVVAVIGINVVFICCVPVVHHRLEIAQAKVSVQERFKLWSACAGMIHDRPLTGWGIGSFPLEASIYAPTIPTAAQVERDGVTLSSVAHNEYLQMGAELGLVGLGLYLAVLTGFFVCGIQALRSKISGTRRWLLLAAFVGVASQSINALSNPGWHFSDISPLLWLLMGMGMAAATPRVIKETQEAYPVSVSPALPYPPRRLCQVLASTGLGLGLILATVSVSLGNNAAVAYYYYLPVITNVTATPNPLPIGGGVLKANATVANGGAGVSNVFAYLYEDSNYLTNQYLGFGANTYSSNFNIPANSDATTAHIWTVQFTAYNSLNSYATAFASATQPASPPGTINVPSVAYPTIQSGVDAAQEGGIVLVADGTYTGLGNRDIDLRGKSLTVMSQAGAGSTIIDCGGYKSTDGSGNHRGFYIHSGEKNVTISGFTVKNGYETYISSIPDSSYGGGVYNFNNSTGAITLTNCTITANTASSGGGGVFNDNYSSGSGAITLTNCTITANTATYGGGVYNYNNSTGTITLTNCTITANTATYGGGVYNDNNSTGTITLTNCTITANTATYGGGGVYNDNYSSGSGAITLTNCTITANTATHSGGVYNDNYSSGTITLTDDIIYGDTGDEVFTGSGTTPAVVSYCDVQGSYPGTGNIDTDPQFVNAACGDLHLKSGSSCIGVGTATGTSATDKDGNLRANAPSIGAYEGVGGGSSGGGGGGGSGGGGGLQRPTGSLTLYDAGYYAAHTDLSDSAAGLADIAELMSDTKICSGAVADGATKVLLRYNAGAAGTVDFTRTRGVSGDNLRPVYGTNIFNLPFTVPTHLINGQNVAFAIYTVPEALDPTVLLQSVNFQAAFTPANGTPGQTATNSLLLRRAPVILIHGFASNPDTWSETSGAWSALEETGFDTSRVDYLTTSNAGFSLNANVLLTNPGGINEVYHSYRARGIAITKVDVVAHSMGGLITRKFAASGMYRSSANFQQGYVRRFITLGTPHSGSPFAADIAALAQNNYYGSTVQAVLSLTPFYYGDAYTDLQPGSGALRSLGATQIPCFAEVGDYFGFPNNLLTGVSNILKFFNYYDKSYDDIFGGESNDFVVGQTSGEGGLPPNYYNIYSGTNHLQETTSNDIGADVVRLLSGPLTNLNTYGFPAPRLPAIVRRASQPRALQQTAPFVTIAAPTAGQTFHSGDRLTISVTPNAGTTLTQVLISAGTNQQTVGSALVSAAPFTTSFTIPSSYLGDLPITIIAQDNASHICNVNGDVFVQTSATLTSMAVTAVKVSPSGAALLTSQGSTDPLTIIGTFSDGVKRDTTPSALGTQYASSDPTVATVSASGVLTALANGNVTIAVMNGTITATEKVIVQLGTPNILSAAPSSATQGATISISLTGTDFGGASQVQFLTNGRPDPNITVTKLQTDTQGTALTATVTIKAGAASGLRTIVVTTPGGQSDPLAAPDAAGFIVQPLVSPAHILWNNPDGRATLWSVNPDNTYGLVGAYGPYADRGGVWKAIAVATGPNGVSRILWTNPDGRATLWFVNPDGSYGVTGAYGPYVDGGGVWRAAALSVGPDNVAHILWNNPDGRATLWFVNPDNTHGLIGAYGPYADRGGVWKAVAIATGTNGVSRILWNNPDGRSTLWYVNPDSSYGVTGAYGPYLDSGGIWRATAVCVGPDNVAHILWNNPDGRSTFWFVNPDASYGLAGAYGPYADSGGIWRAAAIATGPDNVTHILWNNPDGRSTLWFVNPGGAYGLMGAYGPYADSGGVWKATADSAGP